MHGGEALGLQAEVTSQKSAEQKETTDDLNLKCADFFFHSNMNRSIWHHKNRPPLHSGAYSNITCNKFTSELNVTLSQGANTPITGAQMSANEAVLT